MKDIEKEIKKINKNNNLKIDLYILGGINILLLIIIFDYYNCHILFKYITLIITTMIYEKNSLMFGTFYKNNKRKKELISKINKKENSKEINQEKNKTNQISYINNNKQTKNKTLKLTKRK